MKDRLPTLSLWIVPPDPLLDALREAVARFAGLTGTPPFEPHVTLLGDLRGSPRGAHPLARELAEAVAPFVVRFEGLAAGDSFFRSVYLRVAPSEELFAARRAAERLFAGQFGAGKREEAFEPHLSLAYGADDRTREALLAEARRLNLDSRSFPANRITLAHSSSEIPIEQWSRVEEIGLRRRP